MTANDPHSEVFLAPPHCAIPDSFHGQRVVIWGLVGMVAALQLRASLQLKVARSPCSMHCHQLMRGQMRVRLGCGLAMARRRHAPPCLLRADYIIVSPAIRPVTLQQLLQHVTQSTSNAVDRVPGIIGSDQLFFHRHQGPRILITGTKGKSTTAHLCETLLHWPLGGNSFTPLLTMLAEHGHTTR